MKSYIVIGLGRFGGSLARQLCTLGAEVLAMDVHNDLVQQLANDVTHAVVGDARDKEVLRALGVRREILESADGELIIPMNKRCESLNAAVAAAIVMWQMKQ